jgi:hypothetical protein
MFKSLVVLKLEKRKQIILYLHFEIGHFGEGCILVEMNKRYFVAQQDEGCESCGTSMQTMLNG